MRTVFRWHIWLGWVVAIPLLLFTATGLFMALRPIEEVRGTALRTETLPLPSGLRPVVPETGARAVDGMALTMRASMPVWIVRYRDGAQAAFAAQDGMPLPPINGDTAKALAGEAMRVPSAPVSVQRFDAASAPLALRKLRPSWQVVRADGTHVFIDADTGETLAVRTRFWRAFDVAWGLHILDPLGRENSSHPLLQVSAGLSVVSVLLGSILLFRRRKRRKPSAQVAHATGGD